ncbi:serine/threonine-protein phosphatase [Segetibacter sp. 3557_3]|uniref:PP2C family protein-serine/threonine phosphatase n=1 Tax=Segetibacter sp. 3557_3 TaxID=2547429 RepID=UPI0010586FD5|nr:protein phosphatase 2C domain-containing protein [Segetibacter sp. 3557_3]TDH26569.1 serine/threonine-protein phosphatase [Segetibacter sp. 3557_3]
MASNYFGITDTGKVRGNNEDAFLVEPVSNGRFIAACVIDGVGGYSGGEVAARIARDMILEHLKKGGDDVFAIMKRSFVAANEKIQQQRKSEPNNAQMACVVTLALVDIKENKFYYCHVGDTRLYLLRDNSLVKITKDHSFVGFLEDNGRLSEDAAMRHPKRNEINKALGFDAQFNADEYLETADSPFLPGDYLLLCSDGLSDMISNGQMISILNSNSSLVEKGKALVKAANDAGGKDNITVVLVHNDKAPVKQEALRPAVSLKQTEDPVEDEVSLKPLSATETIITEPKKSSTVPILSILCLVLLGAFLWLLYKGYHNKRVYQQQSSNIIVKKDRNEQERRFVDSIGAASNGEVFVIAAAGAPPLTITDSVLINNDSLHIMGNGATLVGDSSYTGPAFTLGTSCRYVLLDSLTLENFDVGVLVQNKGLHLKNVQFKNVRIPVQYQFMFPQGLPVSGNLSEWPIVTDSLTQ